MIAADDSDYTACFNWIISSLSSMNIDESI